MRGKIGSGHGRVSDFMEEKNNTFQLLLLIQVFIIF